MNLPPITILKRNRKTACIKILPTGQVQCLIPPRLSIIKAKAFIKANEDWILKHIAHIPKIEPLRIQTGYSLWLMGTPYQLICTNESVASIRFENGYCHFSYPSTWQFKEKKEFLINWYKLKAKVVLEEKLAHYQGYFEKKAIGFRVKHLKSRLGSCSRRNNLNFNWKLILLPTSYLEYVVVHELSHLIHFDHSPFFWKKVESVLPHYKATTIALKADLPKYSFHHWD